MEKFSDEVKKYSLQTFELFRKSFKTDVRNCVNFSKNLLVFSCETEKQVFKIEKSKSRHVLFEKNDNDFIKI